MNFGEMKTQRWINTSTMMVKIMDSTLLVPAVAKGKDNNDEYEVGDWIPVEHGRWSRGYNVPMGR